MLLNREKISAEMIAIYCDLPSLFISISNAYVSKIILANAL